MTISIFYKKDNHRYFSLNYIKKKKKKIEPTAYNKEKKKVEWKITKITSKERFDWLNHQGRTETLKVGGGVSRGVPKWRKLGGRVDDFFENFWKSFIIFRKFWEFFYYFWKIFENFLFFFENFEKFLIIFQKFWEIFANQRVKNQNLRRFRGRERSWDIL
jgi:hypothetical protein